MQMSEPFVIEESELNLELISAIQGIGASQDWKSLVYLSRLFFQITLLHGCCKIRYLSSRGHRNRGGARHLKYRRVFEIFLKAISKDIVDVLEGFSFRSACYDIVQDFLTPSRGFKNSQAIQEHPFGFPGRSIIFKVLSLHIQATFRLVYIIFSWNSVLFS